MNVHSENPLLDYMHKLKAVIRSIPDDKETPIACIPPTEGYFGHPAGCDCEICNDLYALDIARSKGITQIPVDPSVVEDILAAKIMLKKKDVEIQDLKRRLESFEISTKSDTDRVNALIANNTELQRGVYELFEIAKTFARTIRLLVPASHPFGVFLKEEDPFEYIKAVSARRHSTEIPEL